MTAVILLALALRAALPAGAVLEALAVLPNALRVPVGVPVGGALALPTTLTRAADLAPAELLPIVVEVASSSDHVFRLAVHAAIGCFARVLRTIVPVLRTICKALGA